MEAIPSMFSHPICDPLGISGNRNLKKWGPKWVLAWSQTTIFISSSEHLNKIKLLLSCIKYVVNSSLNTNEDTIKHFLLFNSSSGICNSLKINRKCQKKVVKHNFCVIRTTYLKKSMWLRHICLLTAWATFKKNCWFNGSFWVPSSCARFSSKSASNVLK